MNPPLARGTTSPVWADTGRLGHCPLIPRVRARALAATPPGVRFAEAGQGRAGLLDLVVRLRERVLLPRPLQGEGDRP